MAQINSSKYKDIIFKSTLVHSGRPSVYQLNPKETKMGNIRCLTVGDKKLNLVNKTILLVGATGTGKSTLINALVNYAMGVKWEDDIWFQIVKEGEKKQTESQTSDVVVYKVIGFEDQTLPFSLTLIDTPGYGDTRGTNRDDIVKERLYDLFRVEDGIKEISAVGLVVKAAENRLDNRLYYIFNSVMSLFGKNMEKNIISLITHSDGYTPKNAFETLESAGVKCGKNWKGEPIHFLFNNTQHKDRTEKARVLKFANEISIEGMEELKSFLESIKPQHIQQSLDVLSECKRLPACIQTMQERIDFIKMKETEIQKVQDGVRKCVEGMQEIVEVPEAYKTTESISGGWWGLWFYDGALRCTYCEENCHYPGCTIAASAGHCEVMRWGKCTSCRNRCDVSYHRKETTIYVTKTRTLRMSLEEAHKKYGKYDSEYNKHDTNAKKNSELLEELQKELEGLKVEKKCVLNEAYAAVVKLEEIALNTNSMTTHVHLKTLIDAMNEEGYREKAKNLQTIKERMDTNTRFQEGLKYKLSNLVGK